MTRNGHGSKCFEIKTLLGLGSLIKDDFIEYSLVENVSREIDVETKLDAWIFRGWKRNTSTPAEGLLNNPDFKDVVHNNISSFWRWKSQF